MHFQELHMTFFSHLVEQQIFVVCLFFFYLIQNSVARYSKVSLFLYNLRLNGDQCEADGRGAGVLGKQEPGLQVTP